MIVHNKGNYIRHIGVRLIPGANELKEDAIDVFLQECDHPLNKVLIDNKEIVFELKGISELSAPKASSLVKDTFDLNLLEEWKDAETRKSVLKAIDEQIEAIKNPPSDKIIDPSE